MAGEASALQDALHADVFIVAQSGRARFFADLTGDVIRAGSFASLKKRVHDIKAPRRQYKWKAEGAKILSKIKRARFALDKERPHELFDGN